MHIQMGIGHFNFLLVEYLLDPLLEGVVHIPVVLGLDPHPEAIANGTVAIAGDDSGGGRAQQPARQI